MFICCILLFLIKAYQNNAVHVNKKDSLPVLSKNAANGVSIETTINTIRQITQLVGNMSSNMQSVLYNHPKIQST